MIYEYCYLMPLYLCILYFTMATIVESVKDCKMRDEYIRAKKENEYAYALKYEPQVTYGLVISRIVLSIIPGINVLALSFSIFSDFSESIAFVCSKPVFPLH